MFCSRRANNSNSKLHERAHRLVYDDYGTSFSYLLAIDGSFTVQHTNIQTLFLEMYKIKHKLSESCLRDLFSIVNGNYNLRFLSDFRVYGANSIKYFGSVIWNSLSNDLRNICDFNLFKMTIRRWKSVDCPCRRSKNYLSGLGFITFSS